MRKGSYMVAWMALAGSIATAQEIPAGGADFIQGQQAMRKRDVKTAIDAFRRALDANPDLILSHYYLGYAYQSQRDWEKAGNEFVLFLTQVQLDDPVAAQIVFHARRQGGLALARTPNPTRASPYLGPIVDADPNDAEAHFYLAVAKLAEGETDLAQRLFERALELNHANADAYYYAGRIAFDKAEGELARRRLDRFVQLLPQSPLGAHAHLMLGELARQAGDPAAASAHFEECIERDPEGAHAEAAKRALAELAPAPGGGQP